MCLLVLEVCLFPCETSCVNRACHYEQTPSRLLAQRCGSHILQVLPPLEVHAYAIVLVSHDCTASLPCLHWLKLFL